MVFLRCPPSPGGPWRRSRRWASRLRRLQSTVDWFGCVHHQLAAARTVAMRLQQPDSSMKSPHCSRTWLSCCSRQGHSSITTSTLYPSLRCSSSRHVQPCNWAAAQTVVRVQPHRLQSTVPLRFSWELARLELPPQHRAPTAECPPRVPVATCLRYLRVSSVAMHWRRRPTK